MIELLFHPLTQAAAVIVAVFAATMGAIFASGRRRLRASHVLLASLFAVAATVMEWFDGNLDLRGGVAGAPSIFVIGGTFAWSSLIALGVASAFRSVVQPVTLVVTSISIGAAIALQQWRSDVNVFTTIIVSALVALTVGGLYVWAVRHATGTRKDPSAAD